MFQRSSVGMPQIDTSTMMPRLRRTVPGRLRSKQTLCASNIGQGWSLVVAINGTPVKTYKATTSGSKQAYGQVWWYLNVPPHPDLPGGFHDWVPRCGTEQLGEMR